MRDSESEPSASSAIARRSALFESNFAAGDIDRLVADYFVADGDRPMLSPPGGQPLVVGRAELKRQFETLRTLYSAISIETVELEVGADLASQLGRVRLTRADGGHEVGRYTVLWRLDSEGWRVKLDFFAADAWD